MKKINSNIKNINSQFGLSLIEIQVALVIGLILTAGAAQLFISNQTTYRSETALADLQQKGRFAISTMANDIRMVGYNGCASRDARSDITINYIANATPPYDLGTANAELGGSDAKGSNSWLPTLPPIASTIPVLPQPVSSALQNASILDGTDTITIQRASQCGGAVSALVSTSPVPIQVTNQCGFQQFNPIMITDCYQTDIFQIDNTPATTTNAQSLQFSTALNSTSNFNPAYNDIDNPDGTSNNSAFVYRLLSNTYFIAPSRVDPSVPVNTAEPALWVARWNPQDNLTGTQDGHFDYFELAPGLEDMQIQYGIDNGGDEYADSYVTADAVTDWTTVRSVRIGLLLVSQNDNITNQPQIIQFNGLNVNATAPQDRRLRVVYSSTVSIRNQLQ